MLSIGDELLSTLLYFTIALAPFAHRFECAEVSTQHAMSRIASDFKMQLMKKDPVIFKNRQSNNKLYWICHLTVYFSNCFIGASQNYEGN